MITLKSQITFDSATVHYYGTCFYFYRLVNLQTNFKLLGDKSVCKDYQQLCKKYECFDHIKIQIIEN